MPTVSPPILGARSGVVRLGVILITVALLLILLPAVALAQTETPGDPAQAADPPVVDPLSVDPLSIGGHNCGGTVNPDRISASLDPNGFFSVVDLAGDANAPAAQCDIGCYKGHVGILYRGETSVYTLTLRNEGTLVIHPPLIVTDTLPSGLKFSDASGPGWQCRVITAKDGGQDVVCENGSELQPGAESSVEVFVQVETTAVDRIVNRARTGVLGDTNPNNDEASVPADVFYRADLGDAPDSIKNHYTLTNTAYAGVPGRFPTVWGLPETAPASDVSGPLHRNPRVVWLGYRVTVEAEADKGPDQDMGTNILNGGVDVADQDGGDDGWLNRDQPFTDCRESTLRMRIAKQPNTQPDQMLYLNVWYDGNRDGDWMDAKSCPPPPQGGQAFASEWIVRDFPVNPSLITAEIFEFSVNTGLVMNEKEGDQAWVRFTLADRKAELVPGQNFGDGRGPRYPDFFELGETEDYLHVPGQQPQIDLRKNLVVTEYGQQIRVPEYAVLPGEPVVYELELTALDQGFHTVTVTDALPAGMKVLEVIPQGGSADLLSSGANSGGDVVVWQAQLGSGATDSPPPRLLIRAKLADQVGCEQILINQADWQSGQTAGRSNPTVVRLLCRDVGDAPDSTNHHNGTGSGAMTAYPGVPARFPTVADSTTAPGPAHRLPSLFHLGQRVSFEGDADWGPDADGVNNIQPPANVADKDRFDDGLDLASVNFAHCEKGELKVAVFISPAALAALDANGKIGYLNGWVDANRNGSWGDVDTCGTNTVAGDTPEHIIIDHKVDAGGLGPGLHLLVVPTTGPVPWPKERADQPAWLRLTLSEAKAEKGVGGYGDGRGPSGGFRLGETEDYLIQPVDQRQPDLVVRKQGRILPSLDVSTPDMAWTVHWAVDYANVGSAGAVNVHVLDTFSAPQVPKNQRSVPAIVPTTPDAQSLDFGVGDLGTGSTGAILLTTMVPAGTPPGTVLTNTVKIVSDSEDADLTNNTTTVTVTVPLPPPVITYPIPGTTCDGMVKITGRAYPGADVQVFINGYSFGFTTADSQGNWAYDGYFTDGANTLQVVSSFKGTDEELQAFSATVAVNVDHSLTWSPMSLRFTDEAGRVFIPRGADGRADAEGWKVFLRPGQAYTVSVALCCGAEDAAAVLTLGDGTDVTLTDPDKDGTYTGSFTAATDKPVSGSMKLCVTCNQIKVCSDGTVLIDPEGVIFDLVTGKAISGSTAACLQAQVSATGGSPVFSLWNAADFGQINPQTTGTDGYFSFFTPPGTFRVEASANGYQPYRTEDLVVVDAPVERNIPLTPQVSGPADHVISIGASGFSPAFLTVQPGAVIEWVNVDSDSHTSTSITPTVSYPAAFARLTGDLPAGPGGSDPAAADAWDSGLLAGGDAYMRQLTTPGTYTYGDSTNSIHQATIIVAPAQPEQREIYLPLIVRP